MPERRRGKATVDDKRDMCISVSALQLENETDSSNGVADNNDNDDNDADTDTDDDPALVCLRRYVARYAASICEGGGSESSGGTAAVAAVSARQRANACSMRAAFSDFRFTKSCAKRIGRQICKNTKHIPKHYHGFT